MRSIEEWAGKKIFQRGQEYFLSGNIQTLWREGEAYRALVAGSDQYEVEILLDEAGEVWAHACDCPYTRGELCKHEVAVILAVRHSLEQCETLPNESAVPSTGLHALLKEKSKAELIELVLEMAEEMDCRAELRERLLYPEESDWEE